MLLLLLADLQTSPPFQALSFWGWWTSSGKHNLILSCINCFCSPSPECAEFTGEGGKGGRKALPLQYTLHSTFPLCLFLSPIHTLFIFPVSLVYYYFFLPTLISFLSKELFLTAASPAVKWIIQGQFLTIAWIVLQNTLNSLQGKKINFTWQLHTFKGGKNPFISEQCSPAQWTLSLYLTFSKQFIMKTFTPADKDPVLKDSIL